MLAGFAAVLLMANASYDDYQSALQEYNSLGQGLLEQEYKVSFDKADSKFQVMQGRKTLATVMGIACGAVWAYGVVDAWLLRPDFSAAGMVKTSQNVLPLPFITYTDNTLFTGITYSFK
jgi:hypothetical protein